MVEIMDKYHNQFPFEGFDKAYPQEDIYNSNNMYAFLEDTLLHDFYSMLQSNLNLKERKYAKNIAFQTLFSKVKPESDYAKKLRDIYPAVMNIINDFKETHGYEKFSVGLQNVESEIFIDHIWKRVRDSGINSFTRHDSLLFPIRQRMIVEAIIADVFKHFDFVQKFEYEEFNELIFRCNCATCFGDVVPQKKDDFLAKFINYSESFSSWFFSLILRLILFDGMSEPAGLI
jgi:hypothetical protein